MSCPTATAAYAVGALGTIVATANGGATWSSQTSGKLSDLFCVDFGSARYGSAANPAVGFISGANGVILTTSNGTRAGRLAAAAARPSARAPALSGAAGGGAQAVRRG